MKSFSKVGAVLSLLALTLSGYVAAKDPPQRHYTTEAQRRSVCTPDPANADLGNLPRALCQQYVLGVVDGHEASTGLNEVSRRVFCLPEGTLNAQLTEFVIEELNNSEPGNSRSAAFVVFDALYRAFPCSEEGE